MDITYMMNYLKVKQDIEYFKFSFHDKKNVIDKLKLKVKST